MLKALSERDERALTFSLFRPYLRELADSPVAQGHIRRVISRLFASDYRDFGSNDIPTGLRGLGYFEQELARDFPFYDVAILGEIVRRTGLDLSGDRAGRKVESLLAGRGLEAHAVLVATIRWMMAAVADVIGSETLRRQDEARYHILDIVRLVTSVQGPPSVRPAGEDLYALAAANAGVLVRQLSENHRLAESFARLRDEYLPPPRADVSACGRHRD